MPVLRARFLEFMDDDFNTGGAVGVLFEILSALNKFADTSKLEVEKSEASLGEFRVGVAVLRELSSILGLFWEAPKSAGGGDDKLLDDLMTLLIDLRQEARKTKNFAMADQIRTRLTALGITLEDRAGATGWRKA